MRLVDCYKIAKGNLKRSKLRSTLTMMGVIISISAIVLLVSLGVGLQKLSVSRIASINALTRLVVTSQSDKKIDSQAISEISSLPNIVSSSPQLQFPAKMDFLEAQSDVIIIGMENNYLSFNDVNVSTGKAFEDNTSQAVISKAALKLIGKENDPEGIIGKDAEFSIVTGMLSKEMVKQKQITLTVVGVSDDETLTSIYVPVSLLANGEETNYSSLVVKVSDRKIMKSVKESIEAKGYETTTITDLIDQIDQAFLYFQIILGIIGGIALFVAAIGIINTMTISLLERTHEIGIMKAVGASDWDIWKIFVYESAIMGVRGSFFGIFSGWLVGKIINAIILILLRTNNVNESITLFVMPLNFAIFIFIMSTGLALFAGIYPAIRAARLSPLQALRSQ